MKPREAFDLTMKTFNLKASDISRKTGLSASYISRFRNTHYGGDIGSEQMFKIIKTWPQPIQQYFLGLCLEDEDDEAKEQPQAS